MDVIKSSIPPSPNRPGIEGHGEGLTWATGTFYYKTAKHIPKDKPASLVQESCYRGRQNGDKDWIIVAWDGSGFVVLEHVFSDVRKAMLNYKGLSTLQAIEKAQEKEKKWQEEYDALPNCKKCDRKAGIIFHDNQPRDICSECFSKYATYQRI